MAEFADACDKEQALQAVAILQNAVESLQATLDIFDVRIQDVVILNPKNTLEDSIQTGFVPMQCIQDGFRNSHSFEIRKWGEIKK